MFKRRREEGDGAPPQAGAKPPEPLFGDKPDASVSIPPFRPATPSAPSAAPSPAPSPAPSKESPMARTPFNAPPPPNQPPPSPPTGMIPPRPPGAANPGQPGQGNMPQPGMLQPGMLQPGNPLGPQQAPRAPEKRTLVIGRGISIQGVIQDAERLVVEGTVEAQLLHAVELAIAPGGIYKGEVEVEDAEVAGTIDGSVTARGSLVVRGTGRVIGTARCRRLQVEDGGQISGKMEMITEAPSGPSRAG